MLTKEEGKLLEDDKKLSFLVNSDGWREVLRPWLEERRAKSFPDPTDFKSTKEFTYAAITASVFKKVIVNTQISKLTRKSVCIFEFLFCID